MKPTFVITPQKRTANGYQSTPDDEKASTGERYRVRDKDWVAVWGEDLSLEEANKLRNQVVGRGKSKTARVESMSVPPPDWYEAALAEHMAAQEAPAAPPAPPPNWAPQTATVKRPMPTPPSTSSLNDPQLQQMRRGAVQASVQSAEEAERRARLRANPASPPPPRIQPPKREVPVVSTELPTEEDEDAAKASQQAEEATLEVSDIMATGTAVSDAEVARARAKAEEQRQRAAAKAPKAEPKTYSGEIRLAAQRRYESQMKDGHVPWKMLHASAQANWCEMEHEELRNKRRAPIPMPPVQAPPPVVEAEAIAVEAGFLPDEPVASEPASAPADLPADLAITPEAPADEPATEPS